MQFFFFSMNILYVVLWLWCCPIIWIGGAPGAGGAGGGGGEVSWMSAPDDGISPGDRSCCSTRTVSLRDQIEKSRRRRRGAWLQRGGEERCSAPSWRSWRSPESVRSPAAPGGASWGTLRSAQVTPRIFRLFLRTCTGKLARTCREPSRAEAKLTCTHLGRASENWHVPRWDKY